MGYHIGVGKSDITGPCVHVGFVGMSNVEQRGEGLHMRLFSRTFILVDAHGRRVAIVVVDLAMCSQAVKLEVVRRLNESLDFRENGKPLYTDKNLMITATHTHSGPGGYSDYLAYNASILGFCHQNFECIVSGIIESLRRAHSSIAPGKILIKRGVVPDCGGNRSKDAYMRNPDPGNAEVDREMVLLKFIADGGGLKGMINWFPAHPSTMGEKNRLISGDHKGVASILFEKAYDGIVGAFANSNCGDQSPNMKFPERPPDGVHDIQHCREIGRIQFEAAKQLFDTASTELNGPISYDQAYSDMNCYSLINPDRRTWPAAFGYGMLNGSQEDSEGFRVRIWGEGTTTSNFREHSDLRLMLLSGFLPVFGVQWPEERHYPPGYIDGHAEKPIVFHVGLARFREFPLVPSILPVQMFKIGPLVLAGHPGELTTVSGRRLRHVVQDVFGPDAIVVVATYSNAYASYTATREEYAVQDYEGASTLFGPWTLDAYLQEHTRVAKAIFAGTPVGPGPTPSAMPDSSRLHLLGERLLPDLPFFGRSLRIGDIDEDARPGYQRGDRVSISFLGGNPRNNLRTNNTYLMIERKTAGGFDPVYSDHDLCTLFRWKEHELGSRIIIEWEIPNDEMPGIYRIKYFGDYWEFLPKALVPIETASREFNVV